MEELQRITYEDKVDYQVQGKDEKYRISAKNMNEIKHVFNNSTEAIQNALRQVAEAYGYLGDYKIENGLFYFKRADGTWGEGINLNVSVEEFENIVRRVTSLETNGVAVGDTLPIGSVIYIDGDEKDLPTGYQKLDIVPRQPQQLLINNDFQVWKRGESLTLQNGSYCADMWRIYLNDAEWVTLKKTENGGIQIVGFEGYDENVQPTVNLYQLHYNDAYYEDLKCTVVYSLNNVVNSFERTLKNNSFDNRYCSMVSINDLKAGDILNYVDIYEGIVAYQHVKEDYILAYLRCSPYIQKSLVGGEWQAGATTTTGYINIPFRLLPMKNTPTFEIIDTAGNKGKCDRIGIPYSSSRNQLARVAIYQDTIKSGMTCELISDSGTSAITIRAYVLATCEPL